MAAAAIAAPTWQGRHCEVCGCDLRHKKVGEHIGYGRRERCICLGCYAQGKHLARACEAAAAAREYADRTYWAQVDAGAVGCQVQGYDDDSDETW